MVAAHGEPELIALRAGVAASAGAGEATAVYGAAGAEAFCADTLRDPALAGLRGRVSIAPFTPAMAPPDGRPARVVLTLTDGRTLDGQCLGARGGSDRPFTGPEIEAKAVAILAPR